MSVIRNPKINDHNAKNKSSMMRLMRLERLGSWRSPCPLRRSSSKLCCLGGEVFKNTGAMAASRLWPTHHPLQQARGFCDPLVFFSFFFLLKKPEASFWRFSNVRMFSWSHLAFFCNGRIAQENRLRALFGRSPRRACCGLCSSVETKIIDGCNFGTCNATFSTWIEYFESIFASLEPLELDTGWHWSTCECCFWQSSVLKLDFLDFVSGSNCSCSYSFSFVIEPVWGVRNAI